MFFRKSVSARLRKDGGIAARERRWHDAARLYGQYLLNAPSDFKIWVQCGHANKESGNFNEAERCYLAALMLRSDDADLHLQLGHFYKVTGRDQDARAFYSKCFELDPTITDSELELRSYRLLDVAREMGDAKVSHTAKPAMSGMVSGMESHCGIIHETAGYVVLSYEVESDASLLTSIEREQIDGTLTKAVTLQRIYIRKHPLDTNAWRHLATMLSILGHKEKASRCICISNAVASLKGSDLHPRH